MSEFKAQLAAPAGAAPANALVKTEEEARAAQEQVDASAAEVAVVKTPGKVLEPPEPDVYTVAVPELASWVDVDIRNLTVQYVARNGKSFLTGFTSREHSNPQFYFLKPTHSIFTFFTALADAYGPGASQGAGGQAEKGCG